MPNCCVVGCNNNLKNSSVTLHNFPRKEKDPIRYNAWKTRINRKNFKPTHHHVVCSVHFQEEDFENRYMKTLLTDVKYVRKLKKTCIPSLLLYSRKSIGGSKKVYAAANLMDAGEMNNIVEDLPVNEPEQEEQQEYLKEQQEEQQDDQEEQEIKYAFTISPMIDNEVNTDDKSTLQTATSSEVTTQFNKPATQYEDPPTRKRKLTSYNTNISNIHVEINELDETFYQNKSIDDDELEIFCKLIAVQLKNLPLHNALVCQSKIQSIITQERLKLLGHGSQNSSPPLYSNTEMME